MGVHQYGDKLVPVNDVMDVLIKQYGPVSKAVEYLGIVGWQNGPVARAGRLGLGASAAMRSYLTRIKSETGEDVTEWYPAKDVKTKGADEWTYEKQPKMAEQRHKSGHLFALGWWRHQ